MADARPYFLTGANAKIKINDLTLAFCTNVTYTVVVNHVTPHILGMYEATSVEPVSYNVSGTFNIIRYVADAGEKVPNIGGATSKGNGVGAWSKNSKRDAASKTKDFFTTKRTEDSLNPSDFSKASGFTIEIYQKFDNGETLPVARIRNCRITSASFSLSKQSPAMQQFQFTALYVDEDTFLADFSYHSIKYS